MEFIITGMSCQNCARHVREAIEGVAGAASVDVNLELGRASVLWRTEAAPDAEAVVGAVKAAGYKAQLIKPDAQAQAPSVWSPMVGWRFNVILGLIVTAPLIIGEWIFQLGMTPWFRWFAFGLALPVQVFCGARFYRGAWNQLKLGGANMDTLVALGSTTAFGFSAFALFAGWQLHLYFMEAAAIITLISIGHWLESIASGKAASSLRALLTLAPQTARKVGAGGAEIDAPVSALEVADLVALKPGDRVPIDGEVIEGNSSVDESMLTGESLPIDKEIGSKVYAGTINRNGRLIMRVTATGNATALAQIIAVVRRAQTSRANIQRIGDRISSVFVPVVILVAIATGLWWWLAPDSALRLHQLLAPYLWPAHPVDSALSAAIIYAAGVLIVACPCAMGLATPAAIMAGTNAAARRGILIRDGIALEKSGRLTAVVFDKTGTLTKGEVSVAAVENHRTNLGGSIGIRELAAALAKPSNHPLSKAVARLIEKSTPDISQSDPGVTVTDWQEQRGSGVQGKLTAIGLEPMNGMARLGSVSWLDETGVDTSQASQFIQHWSSQGATLLGLAIERQLIGMLALLDEVKPHAADVVSRLVRQGKSTYLITGDNRLTANAIAQQAGIPRQNVFAQVRPEQKADIIRQLQQRGERVAFVGDGINDAPALEQSDLGVAVSQASDVAREAADIILLKSDIQAIPEALGLAQASLRVIKQNLFWAFFYNAAAVPLAALGFLSPVLCAAAMGLSDLIVIGNALRLLRWKRL